MGNVENKFEETEVLPLQDYVQVQKSTKDNRFGDFTLFSHKDNFSKQIALITKVHSSDQAIDAELARANELKQLTSTPNLINILFLEKKEKSEFCSNYWKGYAGLEYFPFSLSEEIQVRQARKERFTEQELNSLEERYLRGVSDLEYNGVNHLGISTKKFLIGPPSQAKLLFTLPFERENFDVISSDDKFYFSPAMFSAHIHGAMPQHNPSKSDVFSVGMCLLNAASMRNPSTLYNFDSAQIREDKLEQRIESLHGRYSEPFISNLRRMLSVHEDKRPTISDLCRSKDFSFNKPAEWLIYKEQDPYAILKSRRGSRRSMSERDLSVAQDIQHYQSMNNLDLPANNQFSYPQLQENHQSLDIVNPVKTEHLTEPNLLLSKEDHRSSPAPNKEGQVYATLLTNSKKASVPSIQMPANFTKPKGEMEEPSEFQSQVQTPLHKPVVNYNSYTETAIHNHYVEPEKPPLHKPYVPKPEIIPEYKPYVPPKLPVYERYEPKIPVYEPPPMKEYQRYNGVSSNVQEILSELKSSKSSAQYTSPSKYVLLKSQAQEEQLRNASKGNTDALLSRYGLRKSFGGQSFLSYR